MSALDGFVDYAYSDERMGHRIQKEAAAQLAQLHAALDEARQVIEPYSHGSGPLLDERQRAAAAWFKKFGDKTWIMGQ